MTRERHRGELLLGRRIVISAVAILLSSVGVSRLLGQGGGPPFPTPPVPAPPVPAPPVLTPPLAPGAPPSTTPPFATPPIPFLSTAQSTSQASPAGYAGDYIITFRPGTTPADRAAVVQRAGALLRFNYRIVNAAAVRVPNVNVLAALQRDMSVVEIIPDRPVYAIQGPAAPPAGTGKPGGGGTTGQVVPEGVKRVGVPTGTSNGYGVGVAVLDTGIDFNHKDLAPASQWFTTFGTSCQDDNGHGTHVTGTVAALDNTTDVVGVAPLAKPYCVKVLDRSGTGSDSTVIAGLDWVGTNHQIVSPAIRVVNMSLGRGGTLDDNTALRDAVETLYYAGIVVVAAAGNDPYKEVRQMVPATYPEVLAVASTTAVDGSNACKSFSGVIKADTASYFTTDGKFDTATRIGVTISAPGEDKENINRACFATSEGILSTKLGGGTTRMSGTSMAAPHVSGVVARLIQAGWSAVENIRDGIRSLYADRVGVAPLDSPTSGYSFDGEREGIAKAP